MFLFHCLPRSMAWLIFLCWNRSVPVRHMALSDSYPPEDSRLTLSSIDTSPRAAAVQIARTFSGPLVCSAFLGSLERDANKRVLKICTFQWHFNFIVLSSLEGGALIVQRNWKDFRWPSVVHLEFFCRSWDTQVQEYWRILWTRELQWLHLHFCFVFFPVFIDIDCRIWNKVDWIELTLSIKFCRPPKRLHDASL